MGDGFALIARPLHFDLCANDSIGRIVSTSSTRQLWRGRVMAIACSEVSYFLGPFWGNSSVPLLVPIGLTPWGAGFAENYSFS